MVIPLQLQIGGQTGGDAQDHEDGRQRHQRHHRADDGATDILIEVNAWGWRVDHGGEVCRASAEQTGRCWGGSNRGMTPRYNIGDQILRQIGDEPTPTSWHG